MKSAQLALPFYKQGDDVRQYLQKGYTPKCALQQYSDSLQNACRKLVAVIAEINENKGKIEADGHEIWISGPARWINILVRAGVLSTDNDVPAASNVMAKLKEKEVTK